MANLSNINNKFLVTTGGNVLIGQTSAVGSSILQVTGSSTFTPISTVSFIVTNSGNALRLISGVPSGVTWIGKPVEYYASEYSFSTDVTGVGGYSQQFVIENNGDVGIGTSSPDVKIHAVASGTKIGPLGGTVLGVQNNSSTSTNCWISALAGNAGAAALVLGDADDNDQARFQFNNSGRLLQMLNAGAGITINPSGNVGIGISTPYSKLQVNGAVDTLCAHFGGQYNTNGHYQGISLGYAEAANAAYRKVAIVAQATGDGAARQNLLFLVDGASDSNSASIADNKMILNYDGAIKIGNGSNIAINTNGGHYHAAGPSGFSMRQYQYYVDIPNGSTIDLFQNSSAHSDLQMTKISIVMYHSSRTYFAGMGCVGGYGFNLTGAGTGQANGGLTSAVVSTGIRKLQIANSSGFAAAARIFIEIMADSGVTVLNGSISAPY